MKDTTKLTHYKPVIGIAALVGWIIFLLCRPVTAEKGYYVPSPDGTLKADIMKGRRKSTFGQPAEYYRIAVYDAANTKKLLFLRAKPIVNEKFPLSIAASNFALSRDCIQWGSKGTDVTFAFGRTNIVRSIQKK